ARWHQLSSLMSVSAPVAAVVVGDPGRLQLGYSPAGVVHLRYGQAEPVSQAAEPFAAGPGHPLLQLPAQAEISRAGGGARHRCDIRCGQSAWVLLTWCRRIPVHRGLPRVAWPGCLARKLMSSAGRVAGQELGERGCRWGVQVEPGGIDEALLEPQVELVVGP